MIEAIEDHKESILFFDGNNWNNISKSRLYYHKSFNNISNYTKTALDLYHMPFEEINYDFENIMEKYANEFQ